MAVSSSRRASSSSSTEWWTSTRSASSRMLRTGGKLMALVGHVLAQVIQATMQLSGSATTAFLCKKSNR